MRISGNENNITILKELGKRIKQTRIAAEMTQEDLSDRAGVALSTIKRVEKGEGAGIETFLNIMRALNILANVDFMVTEQEILPTEIVDNRKRRSRVRRKKSNKETEWKWGDES